MKAATATCCHRIPNPEGHRALEDIALHRQLGVLLAQPDQLRALVRSDPVTAVPAALVSIDSTQGPFVDAQIRATRAIGLPVSRKRTRFEV